MGGLNVLLEKVQTIESRPDLAESAGHWLVPSTWKVIAAEREVGGKSNDCVYFVVKNQIKIGASPMTVATPRPVKYQT